MTNGENRRLGEYVETSAGGERVHAYVPVSLPPNPPLELGRFRQVYERAIAAVGRLDGVTTILPSRPLFLYMYVRKEALLSSQIEGTQSSLSDLLLFENHEAPAVELDDVTEVSNYVAAIEHGVSRMRGGFPLSLRLVREMHAILLKSGQGAASNRASFAAHRTGSAEPGPATHCSCRRRRTGLTNASTPSSAFYTARMRRCPRSSGRAWPTSNSRRSTLFSTATGAWVGCSSH